VTTGTEAKTKKEHDKRESPEASLSIVSRMLGVVEETTRYQSVAAKVVVDNNIEYPIDGAGGTARVRRLESKQVGGIRTVVC